MDCPIYGKLAAFDTLRFCRNSNATKTNIMDFCNGDFDYREP
jgi:hypothetical protein